MSKLLRKACAEAKEGNANVKQQVRDIGNKFLNSALEICLCHFAVTNAKILSRSYIY